MKRKTKLLATIGPATASYEMLRQLYESGANAFRLNFSHGSHADHQKIIDWTLQINRELDAHIALVADLQGPKLRIGDLDNPILLIEGQEVTFTTEETKLHPGKIPVRFESLARDMQSGEMIMIDDGKLQLEVLESNGVNEIRARVVDGGELHSRKGFNLPDTSISVPSLTPKDIHDLAYILTQPIDWIALSFVRKAEDLNDLREIVRTHPDKQHVKIISKIEKPEALNSINGIIEASDAVMIARGDLGVEIPFEHVPLIQKRIIKKCIQRAKPVIIATQVMESMIDNARPSRAEITDAANGVLDGADALMLSGETSMGNFPVETVRTMDKIIRATERDRTIYHKNLRPDSESPTFLSDAMCFNACKIAEEVEARTINGMTFSGYTAFMLSSYRPKSDIYIFTSNKAIMNALNLVWGVEVFYYDKFVSTDESIEDVNAILLNKGKVKDGDVLIHVASMPIKARGRTNMIRIGQVGGAYRN